MKMLKNVTLVVLAVCTLILMSCSSDDPKPKVPGVKLAVSTTSSSVSSKRTDAINDLKFTSGFITIREVIFDADADDLSISHSIEQVAKINYANGNVSPNIVVEVPAGVYYNVGLGIEMQDDGDDPSVVIEGTYTNSNNVVIPVRFEFNSGEVFEASADVVTIEEGAQITGKITFDALFWFGTITKSQLDNATLTNGVMVISETSNEGIFDIVADRLDVATDAVFQ